jgi:hypothetical protein
MGQILGPYVNHVGSCRDGAGNVFLLATQDGPGSNDTAVVVMKRDVTTGLWSEIARMPEAVHGKPGYGSIENVANNLHLLLSLRTTGGQVLMEHIIPNVCVSWRDAIASAIKEQLAALPSPPVVAVGALAKAIGVAVAPFAK